MNWSGLNYRSYFCCLVSKYWLWMLQVFVAWCQSIGYTCCRYLLPGVRVLAMALAGICCLVSEYWLWLLQVFVAWCQSTGYTCCRYLFPGDSIGYGCCRYLLPGVTILAILFACVSCLMSEYWVLLLHVFGVRVLAMAVACICCLVSEYLLLVSEYLLPGVRVLVALCQSTCCLVSEYWLWLLRVFVAWCQSTGYTCCMYLLPGVRVLAMAVQRNVSLRLCTTCRCNSGNVEVPWSKQCQFRKTQIAVIVEHLISQPRQHFISILSISHHLSKRLESA